MNNIYYNAMNAAEQSMRAQTLHMNNLANLNTTGFKADLALYTSEYLSEDSDQTYTILNSTTADLSSGTIISTERSMDVAIDGEGWFEVQNQNGEVRYTRSGSLQVTETGMLVTGKGDPILGEGGAIILPPFDNIAISPKGLITLQPAGQASNALVTLDRLRLVNPNPKELIKDEDGLFYHISGNEQPIDTDVKLISGFLEGSNVDMMSETVAMIHEAQSYETFVKLMRTVKENDAQAAQIMQTN